MLKNFHAMAYTSFIGVVRILGVMVAVAAAASQLLLRQFSDGHLE
jgi:hypothetical protein